MSAINLSMFYRECIVIFNGFSREVTEILKIDSETLKSAICLPW